MPAVKIRRAFFISIRFDLIVIPHRPQSNVERTSSAEGGVLRPPKAEPKHSFEILIGR